MKRFFLFALVATMFAACITDETQDVAVELAPDTLTVSFEGDDSRIQLQNGKTVWTQGDLVSVFYRSNANQKWQYQGSTGERTGNLKRVNAGNATETTSKVVVVYPYNERYYINPETCDVEAFLPAQQTFLKDSYGLDGNIMISSGYYNQFSLKNVCGWLKVQLTGNGDKVKSIKLKGNNGEQVAGQIYINSATAEATLASEMGGADDTENGAGGNLVFDDTILTEVTLDCGNGVELSAEPTAFYIGLPPQTFAQGLTIEVACSDSSTMTKSTTNAITIARNAIQPMAAFELEVEAPTPSAPNIPNNEIWYTATEKVTPYKKDVFGANIVSNEWNSETKQGVITFDGDVTAIGEDAFYNCRSLTSVTIPDSVTSIGGAAFYGCSKLTSVTIPDSVTSIGGSAFLDCTSLTSVTIPDSVTSIGGWAFYKCSSLTSVTIPDSVTSIEDYAFANCTSLTSVTIPDSVTSIGENAFYYCISLTSVAIGDSVTSIGDEAFRSCTSLTRVDITDLSAWCKISFDSWDSTPLNKGAKLYLNGSELTDITIPSDITEIKAYAFNSCTSLTSVTIPDSVTSIGGWAFYKCSSLTSVTIPDSVTSIEDYAFANCTSLTSVTIPDSVTSIGENAFYYCISLTSVAIGNRVTSIGEEAFYYCKSLTSVTIGNRVTSIGEQAFTYCSSLTSVTIPDSITSIGNWAFGSCSSLKAFYGKFASADNRYLVINGVLHSFAPAGLTQYTIPDSVTSIGENAFSNCTSLTSVTIGNSVTSIGYDAFCDCTSLKEVYCKPTTPPVGGSSMFHYNPSGRKIYVPRASVEAYKAAEYWSDYASDIEGYDF